MGGHDRDEWHPPALSGGRWSAACVEVSTGAVEVEHRPGRQLRTASVAKLFVLHHVAELHLAGELDLARQLDRASVLAVGDSGLWQHLAAPRLAVGDLARLVGTVSDNLATNVLLEHVTLEAVQRSAASLTGEAVLHDVVRDARTPADPATLSTGSARGWVEVLSAWAREGPGTAGALVLDWLSASADLSMAASAFDLDPLAHVTADQGYRVWCKTGTDAGVRADVGVVERGNDRWAYAVICNWEESGHPGARHTVLEGLRGFGAHLRRRVETRARRP